MKYFWLILFLLTLSLTGCNKNSDQYSPLAISGYTNSGIENTLTIKNPTVLTSGTGNILLGVLLSGSDYKITISGNTLTYNGIFHFDFPQDLFLRDYNFSMMNTLFLFNNSYTNSLNVFYSQKPISEVHKLCIDPERLGAGYTGVSNKKIFLQKVPTYIINARYETRSPEQGKQSRPIQEICFGVNNMMYIISLSNYDRIQFQKVLDSFQFIK